MYVRATVAAADRGGRLLEPHRKTSFVPEPTTVTCGSEALLPQPFLIRTADH